MDELTHERSDRRPGHRLVQWFLVGGDRLWVSLVIILCLGAAFVAVGVTGLATVTDARRVMWYLNGTVNGLLTLVPITVGVNQIVLSHEFGSIRDLEERRTDITEFREQVEETTDTDVVSPEATAFFRAVLSAVSETAGEIRADQGADDQLRSELDSFGESVGDEAEKVRRELTTDDTSMVQTLLVVLSYEDSRQFHEARRLRSELSGGDAPSDELERLTDLFVQFDAARQFLKTIVVERQLARLSRLLIYTSLPAVTIAAIAIFSYRDLAGIAVPRVVLVGVVAALVVATLAPLAILGAFILRVATIALQTASYGPFIPESSE